MKTEQIIPVVYRMEHLIHYAANVIRLMTDERSKANMLDDPEMCAASELYIDAMEAYRRSMERFLRDINLAHAEVDSDGTVRLTEGKL